jgi:hypothetical protein
MPQVYAGWPYNMCQLGREVTPGTAVVATSVWRGLFGGPEDDRNREIVSEDVGILAPTTRVYDTALGVKIAMPATPLTYEQLPHILEAGVMTATPSGAGPYTRAYLYSLAQAPNAIKTYTLEMGNWLALADLKKIPYSYVTEFTLSGKAGEAWEMEATWQGQQLVTLATFTAAIALPAVKEAVFPNTKLYIDATGGTIGTTQVLGVLMAAKIKVKSGIVAVPVGDGNLFYSAIKYTRPEVTFVLTMELEQNTGVSRVATERAIYEAQGTRLIRLQCTQSPRDLKIDIAGKYTKIGAYNKEGDGNTTVDFEGYADYSATDALYFTTTVINAIAAM